MAVLKFPIQIIGDSAHELYWKVIDELQSAEEVASIQDAHSIGSLWGMRDRPTRELRHVTLVLTEPRNRIVGSPFAKLERMVPRTILSTLSDEIDADVLAYYDPRAKEFSDDGKTVTTNYGSRIRNFESIQQIEQVIDQFKKDRNTRRAVIHIHTPTDAKRKYDPCIDSLHFLIRNEKLECRSHWRSENGLTLLPTNLFEFTMLQELIASELGIDPGIYVQTVTSLHYYLDDQEKLSQSLAGHYECPPIMDPMPIHSLAQIETLRMYEKTWRENPLNAGIYYPDEPLLPYWQKIGEYIASAISKKSRFQ